jgi:hypothetical protein
MPVKSGVPLRIKDGPPQTSPACRADAIKPKKAGFSQPSPLSRFLQLWILGHAPIATPAKAGA